MSTDGPEVAREKLAAMIAEENTSAAVSPNEPSAASVIESLSDRMRTKPKADRTLHCSKCHRELPAAIEVHQGRTSIRCECGHITRVIRAPRPVQPRGRPRMSKKDRKRLRRRLAADVERARARAVAQGGRGSHA